VSLFVIDWGDSMGLDLDHMIKRRWALLFLTPSLRAYQVASWH
jgi:hypothetical protein